MRRATASTKSGTSPNPEEPNRPADGAASHLPQSTTPTYGPALRQTSKLEQSPSEPSIVFRALQIAAVRIAHVTALARLGAFAVLILARRRGRGERHLRMLVDAELVGQDPAWYARRVLRESDGDGGTEHTSRGSGGTCVEKSFHVGLGRQGARLKRKRSQESSRNRRGAQRRGPGTTAYMITSSYAGVRGACHRAPRPHRRSCRSRADRSRRAARRYGETRCHAAARSLSRAARARGARGRTRSNSPRRRSE
ncbi:hypothetical protein BH160DRAFT_4409 [Burkholderia sp. H160]|nr:hypothetical protein BH160DRAFT_4409 [Burkholderia sp. H160]